MNTKTQIAEYEIDTHGISYPDYFQGAGVSFTRFEEIATGCGETERDALNDALEQIATCGVEIPSEMESDLERANSTDLASHSEDGPYWYVSVRYNLKA
jgi:hypothetical protein